MRLAHGSCRSRRQRGSGARLESAPRMALAASLADARLRAGLGVTTLRCGRAAAPDAALVRLRPRRDRRPALRRRLVRPAHGQALARGPHDRQRLDRRSRAAGLSARRRARLGRRPGSRADARLSPQRASRRRHRASAERRGARGGGGRDDRRLSRRALVGPEPRFRRGVRHGREDARRIRRGVPAGAEAGGGESMTRCVPQPIGPACGRLPSFLDYRPSGFVRHDIGVKGFPMRVDPAPGVSPKGLTAFRACFRNP